MRRFALVLVLLVAAPAAAQKSPSTPNEYAAEMLRNRQSVAATVDGLRRTYRQSNDAVVATLVRVGYRADDVALQMIATDRVAADQTARWLLDAGTPARTTFDAVSRHAPGDLERVARTVLGTVDVKVTATRDEWSRTLRQNGFTAVQVVGVFGIDFPRTPTERAAALLAAGYSATDIAAMLKSDGAAPASIVAILHDLGISALEAATAARDALGMTAAEATAALLDAQYDTAATATAIDELFEPAPAPYAAQLKVIGIIAIVVFLVILIVVAGTTVVVGLPAGALATVVGAMIAAGFSADAVTQAMKEQGVAPADAAAALMQSSVGALTDAADALYSIYQLDAGANVTTLHGAGATWSEALVAVNDAANLSAETLIALFMELNIQDADAERTLFEILKESVEASNEDKAFWLAKAGMSAARIAKGFREVLGLDAVTVAKLLVPAGFSDAATVAAALLSAGFISPLEIATALKAAGFDLAATQAAMLAIMQLSVQQMQQILAAVFGSGQVQP